MSKNTTAPDMPKRIKSFSNPVLEARFMELGILAGETVQEIGRAPLQGAHRILTSKGVFGLRTEEWASLQFEL